MGDWSVVEQPVAQAQAKSGASDWSVVEPGKPQAAPAAAPSGVASTNAAIYHGIANGGTLGAGAAVSAAIDTAINKVLPRSVLHYLQKANEFGGSAGLPLDQDATYDQRRAAYAGEFNYAQQQHPVAFGAGEVAGGLAGAGSGVAAGEAVTGHLGGGIGARLAGAAAGGAVTGAEFGAGTAASQGLDPLEGAKLAGKSALAGAGTGAALHGVTELGTAVVNKASKALEDKYVQTFGAEVLGKSSKKATKAGWSNILGKAPEEGVEERAAQKYVASPEMQPVEAAARHGKYDDAIQAIDQNLAKYRPGRLANYQAVEEAKPFLAGEGLASLDKKLFEAKNKLKDHQAVKALKTARQEWISDYSSADAGAVQRALLRPEGVESTEAADQLRAIVDKLPQSGPVTRTQFARAAEEVDASPGAIQYINDHILDAKQGLLHWDPNATLPAVELRAEASKRQKSAMQAFDALNPAASEHAKSAIKQAITSALEKHLDTVAAKSPDLAQVVRRIRQDDVKFSVLLAAKQGLREAADKTTRDQLQTHIRINHALSLGTLPAALIFPGEANKAVNDLSEGKYEEAALHGGIALATGGLAARGIYRGSSIAHNRLSNSLANLPNSPGATAFMQMLRDRLPNAVTGTVTQATLGQVKQ
jgi:hypothetical protein